MKISVITPTFNREECVERCLESVSVQLADLRDGESVEHVIVDDGSADGSAAIIGEYASKHPHVKPIYFARNRGVNAARNAAIEAASGELCLILDSDDRLTRNALRTIFDTVKESPEYDSYMFTVSDRAEEMKGEEKRRVFRFEDFLLERVGGDFGHLIRRRVMLAHPFDEFLRIYEGIFFLSFYKDAGKMLLTNVVTHERERDRPDSVTLTVVRYNDDIIRRKLVGAKLQLETFKDDYAAANERAIPARLAFEIADNALLLGDYDTARTYLKESGNTLKSRVLKTIAGLHARHFYKRALQLYLSLKHKRPERGVN